MKIRIGHFSDTHGRYAERLSHAFEFKDIDFWVCTGDLMPNSTRAEREYEVPFQTKDLEAQNDFFKKLFAGKPVLVQDGNHCYAPTQKIWSAAGIDARQVERTKKEIVVKEKTLSYAGFREINWIAGEWAGETHHPEITAIVDQVVGVNPDLLITHAPTQGIMDGIEDRYGVGALASQLFYRENTIKAHLHGHTHKCRGFEEKGGILFSNAATTAQVVELDV